MNETTPKELMMPLEEKFKIQHAMKILDLFTAALILLAQPASAQNPQSVRIAHGPYLQAVGENEFTVVWKTNMDALGWIEIAPDDGTHFYNTERRKFCQVIDGLRPVTTFHTVRVTGLKPGTRYRYRVMQKGVLKQQSNRKMVYSEGFGSDILHHAPYQVRTMDKNKENICFSVVNDMHENDSTLRLLYKDMEPEDYDFILFGGDMTSALDSEEDIFRNYMDSASELFAADTPLFVAKGNHEFRGTYAVNWMKHFPSSTGHPYFSFRHGPAYFIILDSGEDKPDNDIRNLDLIRSDQYREEQVEWLGDVMQDPEYKDAPMKIVFSHMPPVPGGWHGDSEIARLFNPIFNDAGIDLMLCGHEHAYFYFEPDTNGNDFPIVVNPNLTRMDIKVNATEIELKIYDTDGNILHRHSFKKR